MHLSVRGGCTFLPELEDRAQAMHHLSKEVASPCQSSKTELGGCTSRQSSELELWRCYLLTEEVAPPSLTWRLSRGRLHLLAGAVAPPSLAGRLSLGGCTSLPGRLHLPQLLGFEWVEPFDPT